MFSKILIANRGEIALRIIRACKEMNIQTVAVYSEADADSLHVRLADEAICIGPADPQESYLSIPAIISAAEVTDVEAIHAGYGFLAENAHFAEVCESCNITFIGPTPQTIRLMGDKMAAKELMRKAGVPVIPGSVSVVKSAEEAVKTAHRIKYPVIIKAAAGGGGRGMRIAHNDVRLGSALITAQSEAEAAFGNRDVYLEKLVDFPRHIEFQILADKHNKIVQLGERDCTLQRRHQKLLEETPSPVIDSKLRRKMADAALRGAKAANYVSVGTVEFLVDREHNFYFMEMNTRIQVEHPITEQVTGLDLVKEQIRIAAGERLSIDQDEVRSSGHAMECRINAEDPDRDFVPMPGAVQMFVPPGGPRVRFDSHLYQGYVISPYYDSLVAKLITHGRDRGEAIRMMNRALDELIIEPIKTTIPFHKRLLSHPLFIRGQYSTDFVERLLGGEG